MTREKQPILKVAVAVPLSRAFDYLPPDGGPVPQAGCRVRVQFGPRQAIGLVAGHATESGVAAGKIRRCSAVLDERPLLGPGELELLRFTSDYYHHPIGEVAATALPTLLRQGKGLHPVVETLVATGAADATDIEGLARRAPKQAELLETVCDAGGNGIEASELTELLPNWRRVVRALLEKGLVERIDARAPDFDETLAPEATAGPTTTAMPPRASTDQPISDHWNSSSTKN